MLLPQTNQEAALLFEQRLRQALFNGGQSQPVLAVNYSAGLAMLAPVDSNITALMARADGALYLAKARGRGRLEIAP